ncbi:MAG TPA: DNA mismatch repair endonuclease MutL [bacterium (Candidatus Stahlbacteria)]|nr:DNA mismatch repair endonuclease MutL [Candidatus Stahlbacteria bacterium]
MARIKHLPEDLISKIAAGEIIFRPQSVVKELIENAIDAGARDVKINAVSGGKVQLSIFDNGSGMDPEDLKCCYLRHTTSKIKNEADLANISSLGFRGEALASIAAVSRLRISSRPEDRELGYLIEVIGGQLKQETTIGMDKGTEIIVSDLFFNLPARRKFLRSDKWETRLIIEKVKQYALAYPEKNFSLTVDGREVINLLSDREEKRIEQITGIKQSDIIKISGGRYPVEVNGYLSDPIKNRNGESLVYVNRRPVTDRKINSLIKDYYNIDHPFYLLFLEVAPEFIDINVHPSKSEIRFHDQRYLFDLLKSIIRRQVSEKKVATEQIPIIVSDGDQRLERLFQIHRTYILTEIKDGIIIVDQHAAHERIIFEQILRQKSKGQPLLFPISVELDEGQFSAYEDNKDYLHDFGIQTMKFSHRTIVVETIPDFTSLTVQDVIAILNELMHAGKKKEEIAKVIACHSAIKANTVMTDDEMAKLIDMLFGCENPYFCPHGRPTIIRMDIDELNRRLGRR